MAYHVIELPDDEHEALLKALSGVEAAYGDALGRALESLRSGAPSASVTAMQRALRMLGEHDGDPMSRAPSRAAGVLRSALESLGVGVEERGDEPRPFDTNARPA